METADIITLIGIIITAVLAGANLVTAFFNQRQSQGYNLRMADYERRYVQLTDNVSQYISMLDAHWLSFMALNEEEYEGKDAEIYERYHQMETAHYKIKLLCLPHGPVQGSHPADHQEQPGNYGPLSHQLAQYDVPPSPSGSKSPAG